MSAFHRIKPYARVVDFTDEMALAELFATKLVLGREKEAAAGTES